MAVQEQWINGLPERWYQWIRNFTLPNFEFFAYNNFEPSPFPIFHMHRFSHLHFFLMRGWATRLVTKSGAITEFMIHSNNHEITCNVILYCIELHCTVILYCTCSLASSPKMTFTRSFFWGATGSKCSQATVTWKQIRIELRRGGNQIKVG